MAKKQVWRFTFGVGQKNAGYCQPIYGTFSSSRDKMFEMYGDKWCFQYSEEEWETCKKKNPFIEKDLDLVKA